MLPRVLLLPFLASTLLACSDDTGDADGNADGSAGSTGPTSADGSATARPTDTSNADTASAPTTDEGSSGTESTDPDSSGTAPTTDTSVSSSPSDTDTDTDTGDDTGAPDCSVRACDGNPIWARRYGNEDDSGDDEYMRELVTDAAGYTTIAGTITGTADLAGAGIVEGPAEVLVRFDPDGEPVWVVELPVEHPIERLRLTPDGDLIALESGWWGTVHIFGVTQGGEIAWEQSFAPTSGTVAPVDLAIASDGRIAIAGLLNGSVDFGGALLDSTGFDSPDAFVAVFDDELGHLWSRRVGDAQTQEAFGVGFAADGHVLLTGDNDGAIDFGGGEHDVAIGWAMWWAKLDATDGEELASAQFDTPDTVRPFLAVLPDAEGFTLWTYNMGPTAIDFGDGFHEGSAFLARYGGGDALSWVRPITADGGNGFEALVQDDGGSLVVAGSFDGSIDLGDGDVLTTPGAANDGYVAKYGLHDGALVWKRVVGDDDQQNDSQDCVGAGVDADGNVYGGGHFSGVIDLGFGDLVSGNGYGGADLFLMKLEP